MRISMLARRSVQGSVSAAQPGPPEADEALRRLGDGLGRAGWAVALTTDQGRVIWANGPMLALAGAGPSGEWPGATLSDCFATDPDVPSLSVGGVLSPRTGPRRWLRSIPLPWEGGILHLLADCSPDVLAERERRGRDVYLSRAVEDSVDAILSLDNEGRIQYWNHGAERMFK